MVGCFSGINAAGLCVASHEVFTKHPDRTFDPAGLPFAIGYRRLLEECDTVAAAVALIHTLPRATTTLLVLCEPAGGAVLEVTPDRVVRRPAGSGVCVCTNLFTIPGLTTADQANAYKTLDRVAPLAAPCPAGKLGVAGIQARLHAAHQGELTIQTMMFDPAGRTIHLDTIKGADDGRGASLAGLDGHARGEMRSVDGLAKARRRPSPGLAGCQCHVYRAGIAPGAVYAPPAAGKYGLTRPPAPPPGGP